MTTKAKGTAKTMNAGAEAAKALIGAVAGKPIDGKVIEDTAHRIAERRASPEGKEGLTAFLEKRKPSWVSE